MSNERADKVKEITEQLHEGVKQLYQSDKYMDYLRTMSKFHHYSANNCLLIALQRPDASAVAGYRAWATKFNRHVKKGSTGIAIIEPAPWQRKGQRVVLDEKGQPVMGPDGEPLKQDVEYTVQSFKVGYVFAYEDTEGEPLPSIAEIVDKEVKDYDRLMEVLQKVSPVPISLHEISGGANGYFSHATRDIHVKSNLPQGQIVKTTIHEVAHALLHDKVIGEDQEANQREREVCAESVAFVVCNYLGLDTSEYSFGYIGGWSKGHELKELQEKMELIRKTADTIISGIEAEIMSQTETQDITATAEISVVTVQPQVAQATTKEAVRKPHRHRR